MHRLRPSLACGTEFEVNTAVSPATHCAVPTCGHASEVITPHAHQTEIQDGLEAVPLESAREGQEEVRRPSPPRWPGSTNQEKKKAGKAKNRKEPESGGASLAFNPAERTP
ncbi:hypothetical protein GCM10022224_031630 [Nonomuraea antimicrobica]|uniref:Uncharacterized protein n=1 Tax=Nonomuraea antimicrobica TaxID=561173 RepID=A0ABP7BP80_9ACTN